MRRFTGIQRDDDIEAQVRRWEMKRSRISIKKLRLDMDICFNPSTEVCFPRHLNEAMQEANRHDTFMKTAYLK
jgi:hypothetical protein